MTFKKFNEKKTSARSSSILKSKFVDMLWNIRNLTERGKGEGGIRNAPSCYKCMLYRPYEVLMWSCLMRSECWATAARIHSVSDQSNKIPRDEEGRPGGESQESSCGALRRLNAATFLEDQPSVAQDGGRKDGTAQASSGTSGEPYWPTFSLFSSHARGESHLYNYFTGNGSAVRGKKSASN